MEGSSKIDRTIDTEEEEKQAYFGNANVIKNANGTYQCNIRSLSYPNWSYLTSQNILAKPKKCEIIDFNDPTSAAGSICATYELEEIDIKSNAKKCLDFIGTLKDKCIELESKITVFYQQNGLIVLVPWIISCYTKFPENFFDSPFYDEYWSSLNANIPKATESRVMPYGMRMASKLATCNIFVDNSTEIAYRIKLSDESLDNMEKMTNESDCLKNSNRVGDNQIWMNNKYVFKMFSDLDLYLHEVLIYNKQLPYMPKLIDTWRVPSDNEYFCVFEKNGHSLNDLYHLDLCVPEEIMQQKNQLMKNLMQDGIKFYDSHLGNFLQTNDDKLYVIDAESMVHLSDIQMAKDLLKKYNKKTDEIQQFTLSNEIKLTKIGNQILKELISISKTEETPAFLKFVLCCCEGL